MRFYGFGSAVLAVSLFLSTFVVPAAAADEPKATDLIFEHKHLDKVEPGTEIKYNFNRTVTDPKILGLPFSDTITLKVVADKGDHQKDLEVQIYTGDRARDLQKLEKFTINPIFAVFFAQSVNTFNQLAGGQMNYLQRVYSDGWMKSKIEPIKVDYKGNKVDAYRITMTPFVGDKYETKMQGWEGAKYQLTVSDAVPGEIVDMLATYHNRYPPATLKLTERTTLDGVTGLENPE